MTAVGTSTDIVQTAIYAKLTSDTTFMGLVTGVFDWADVPENQPFPYVTLGDITELQDDTMSSRVYDGVYTPHIWTQSTGMKRAKTILARMNQLLHKQPLTLTFGQIHVGTWYLTVILTEDPDGITQHGVPRYRILTEEAI